MPGNLKRRQSETSQYSATKAIVAEGLSSGILWLPKWWVHSSARKGSSVRYWTVAAQREPWISSERSSAIPTGSLAMATPSSPFLAGRICTALNATSEMNFLFFTFYFLFQPVAAQNFDSLPKALTASFHSTSFSGSHRHVSHAYLTSTFNPTAKPSFSHQSIVRRVYAATTSGPRVRSAAI